jgi:outer membrane immunogenic protein
LGFTAGEQTMVYGTGGLAYGRHDSSVLISSGVACTTFFWPNCAPSSGSSSDVKTGWTVGGGAETALTRNVTVKLDYLHYNLGTATVLARRTDAAAPGLLDANGDMRLSRNIARVELSYKFD